MEKRKRKGRWLRGLLRILITVIGLIINGCFVVDHFYQFRHSDDENEISLYCDKIGYEKQMQVDTINLSK